MLKSVCFGLWGRWLIRNTPFRGSADYWRKRYRWGGNSGPGSSGLVASMKAKIINDFVRANGIRTVIEFGCGDGTQLSLSAYPAYTGFDVSEAALRRCRKMFRHDPSKVFRLVEEYDGETAELALSLQVIFHLVEDEVYDQYMRRLFGAATRFVLIHSTDYDGRQDHSPHCRHRRFTDWIDAHAPGFYLRERIAGTRNARQAPDAPSMDFFVFERTA